VTKPAEPVPGGTVVLVFNVFDGNRRPFVSGPGVLFTVKDRAQKVVYRSSDYPGSGRVSGASVLVSGSPVGIVEFRDNLNDLYTVSASASGYQEVDVPVLPGNLGVGRKNVDLMLIPKDGKPHFVGMASIKAQRPILANLLGAGVVSVQDADRRYQDLMENRPLALACLLNLTTALSQLRLASGTPTDYLKELIWDNSMTQDRFFAWADAKLVDQVATVARSQGFAFKPDAGYFLSANGAFGPATRSYRQTEFDAANLQLGFHERNRHVINGIDCIIIEVGIDYYGQVLDRTAVASLLAGTPTDPRHVYALRWMASCNPAFQCRFRSSEVCVDAILYRRSLIYWRTI
jgi:hypothetical protein